MPLKSTTPHRRFFVRPAVRKSAKRNHPLVCSVYFHEPPKRDSGKVHAHDYSASMSSITPQSFVDDGGSFTKRVPRSLDQRQVTNWIASNSSDTSAYTGSFVDDGADMHLPPGVASGFGPINTQFYKQKKRKEARDGAGTAWNDDVQKAISGDIQRNLEKVRGLRGVEVKKADQVGRHGETVGGQEKTKQDTVTIPMPPQWGTFVIKADDGRVIVVDKDGEFDSGPRKTVSEPLKRWVKAASTVEPDPTIRSSIPASPPKHRTYTHLTQENSKKNRKQKTGSEKRDGHRRSCQSHPSSPKILAPTIPESECEEGYLPSGSEDMGSPTGFMMTGGASGWPCSRATSVASPAVSVGHGYEYMVPKSPIRAINEGFRHVAPRSRGTNYVVPESKYLMVEEKASPVPSLPGGWPSPELSPDKGDGKAVLEGSWDGGQFESAWKAASPSHSDKSNRSHHTTRSDSSQAWKKDSDSAPVKSRATYRAPTVEDAAKTSSEEKEDHIATGWGGSVKSSGTHGWGGSKKGSEKRLDNKREDRGPAWTSATNTPHPHTWAGADSKSPSEQSWSKRLEAADNASWTGIESSGFQQAAKSPTCVHFGSPTRPSSDATWDGLERNKSASEVGVMDTGSERAWLGRSSRVSSRQSAHPSHHSRGTHASHRSSRHTQATGWGDGQTDWPGSRGDDDKGKNANGFDEDKATYLNDKWGGIPVRVGSRAGSPSSRQSGAAAGWE